MLRAHGLRTGLYTSPHLERFEERIRVDGRLIPKDRVAALTEALREATRAMLADGRSSITPRSSSS